MDLTFTFSKEDSQIILDALVQCPYIMVAHIIDDMQRQASEQMEGVAHGGELGNSGD